MEANIQASTLPNLICFLIRGLNFNFIPFLVGIIIGL